MRAKIIAVVALAALLGTGCGGGGVRGSASVTDPVDGSAATNSKGKHPTKTQDSADIRSVSLDADGSALTIEITVAGPVRENVPNDIVQGPDWFLQVWRGERAAPPDGIVGIVRRGTVNIQDQRVIAGWEVLACLGSASCDTVAKGATWSIDGEKIKAVVPLGDLPKLVTPFTWAVFSFWNETTDIQTSFTDWAPDSAKAPATGFSKPEGRGIFN